MFSRIKVSGRSPRNQLFHSLKSSHGWNKWKILVWEFWFFPPPSPSIPKAQGLLFFCEKEWGNYCLCKHVSKREIRFHEAWYSLEIFHKQTSISPIYLVLQLIFTMTLGPQHTTASMQIYPSPGAVLGKKWMCDLLFHVSQSTLHTIQDLNKLQPTVCLRLQRCNSAGTLWNLWKSISKSFPLEEPFFLSVFSLLPYSFLPNCSVCLIGKGIMRSGMLTVLEQWAGITIKITNYQHVPMSALPIQGANISTWFTHGSWWSSTRRRLFSHTVHFWTPWKAEEEQQEQCGVRLLAQIISELSQSTVTALVTHTRHYFLLQTIPCFLHDNWSTGKVHTRARCEI